MGSVAGVVAHGGVGGAIAEAFIAIAVAAVFVAVWVRERRARRGRTEDEMREQDD